MIFQHVAEEGPGLIEDVLKKRGEPYRIIRSYEGDPVPREMEGVCGLVVMGGPMNVDETHRYPFLKTERELITQAVSRGIPVLGVCLGAQMLACALGAKVWKGPQLELGFDLVEPTVAGAQDFVLSGMESKIPVFQWHRDTFELPAQGVLLASSPLYANQAFRVGPSAYGFQFHLEITEEILKQWAAWMQRDRMPGAKEAQNWAQSEKRLAVHRAGKQIFHRFFSMREVVCESKELLDRKPSYL